MTLTGTWATNPAGALTLTWTARPAPRRHQHPPHNTSEGQDRD